MFPSVFPLTNFVKTRLPSPSLQIQCFMVGRNISNWIFSSSVTVGLIKTMVVDSNKQLVDVFTKGLCPWLASWVPHGSTCVEVSSRPL
ncbi:hypothetical protein HanRHA438_Chr17g0812041 [Helianthus annuus]|uniref:Uncharacterized protein n=1 Tax=Helianthus annuus TaxID=4232 RepID=A0A9K3DI07_HELAN|nr:hypothetical protein HanXRQr2_Chr17g0802101 [Helianthus annuus]KAJ0429103.1 hypothetical protein HanHA300_Chr17g0653571 [Helianthus annuus]KAJ0447461.1 hypothetical protein HanHA89_Chr17g0705671 [Helianthus annuus]KAJ0632340.1 hypothetical protein HanLR1_Chr17g0664071 [Helianthus annuus]KAJ0813104.1 hypothetical protein HanPSC8_Chr17g0769681 [Helianthus annuus]